MLLPAMLVLLPLFGGSLVYGLLQSLGWQPIIGRTEISLAAYREILFGTEYAHKFWEAVGFSLWISFTSTALSTVLAVGLALLVRRSSFGKGVSTFLLQFSLPVPHLVAAIGVLFLLSQSGLASRAVRMLGLMDQPAGFPVLVRDSHGLGVIFAYLWKEVPFMGLVVLAALQSVSQDYEDSARSLGAGPWQRFRYITLPVIAPSLAASSILVFTYVFGAYEIPGILGVRNPQSLPVLSYELFVSPDLRDRAAAMALSVIMSTLVLVLVALYLALVRRLGRNGQDLQVDQARAVGPGSAIRKSGPASRESIG
jgi:putative spermidine/putrescine transport system permease protein